MPFLFDFTKVNVFFELRKNLNQIFIFKLLVLNSEFQKSKFKKLKTMTGCKESKFRVINPANVRYNKIEYLIGF